jgi:hypothetical protein
MAFSPRPLFPAGPAWLLERARTFRITQLTGQGRKGGERVKQEEMIIHPHGQQGQSVWPCKADKVCVCHRHICGNMSRRLQLFHVPLSLSLSLSISVSLVPACRWHCIGCFGIVAPVWCGTRKDDPSIPFPALSHLTVFLYVWPYFPIPGVYSDIASDMGAANASTASDARDPRRNISIGLARSEPCWRSSKMNHDKLGSVHTHSHILCLLMSFSLCSLSLSFSPTWQLGAFSP